MNIEWVYIPEGTFIYGLTAEQKADIRARLWADFGLHELDPHQQSVISGLMPKFRRRGRERGVYKLLSDVNAEEKSYMHHFIHHGKPLVEYLSIEDNLETIPDAQEIWLPGYHISKYPITIEQANEFLKIHKTPYYPPKSLMLEQPQQLNFDVSENIAAWLGARLPTPQEWEKAARGNDGLLYPWGNTWDATRGNFTGITPAQDPVAFDSPRSSVHRYPAGVSPFDVWDMCGNVSEWVFAQGEGIQRRGLGFKELSPPLWYWEMATTWLKGARGKGWMGVGLRVIKL